MEPLYLETCSILIVYQTKNMEDNKNVLPWRYDNTCEFTKEMFENYLKVKYMSSLTISPISAYKNATSYVYSEGYTFKIFGLNSTLSMYF